jgi:galactose-1-phosphate uridylyltransferase
LCKENIAVQNPAEILLPLRLAGEDYFAGANFAYIENNHFTIISSRHRNQLYERHILVALKDFIEQTDGYFSAIFNGLAGASILRHEHFQVTSEPFPIEDVRVRKQDVVFQKNSLRVARPFYYTPLWIVEGKDKNAVIDAADRIIVRWHKLNQKEHTENVIAVKSDGLFRMFIFLRDTRRLAGEGKFGSMASFECGGSIVLSYQPPLKQTHEANERNTFDVADVATVRMLLADIVPIVPDVDFG